MAGATLTIRLIRLSPDQAGMHGSAVLQKDQTMKIDLTKLLALKVPAAGAAKVGTPENKE